jgi:uracil-DNA glycosylase family 4
MEWHGRLPSKKTVQGIKTLPLLDKKIIACRECPRLVDWREEVALTKRKAYQAEKYWGKAVPGFGSTKPKLMIVGLAPGAHGANRTGRIFTGDPSGDWLYGSLHRLGIAKIATSTSRDDGQELLDTRISMAVRCAPPDNKPSNKERDQCAPWFLRELELSLPTTRAFVALGNFAWVALFSALAELGHPVKRAKFGHGAEVKYEHNGVKYLILASFHPSQQNTFTGKLTKPMLDSVLKKAGRFAHVIR